MGIRVQDVAIVEVKGIVPILLCGGTAKHAVPKTLQVQKSVRVVIKS